MGLHVGPSQPLMEAGLDSLAAVELRSAMSARFGIAVPATVALDHPNVQVCHPHHLLQADNTERTYPWIIPLSCKISQSSQHLRKGSIAVVLVSNTRRGGFTVYLLCRTWLAMWQSAGLLRLSPASITRSLHGASSPRLQILITPASTKPWRGL